jgi:catechol 2,3-dioxygenase-like lactoylglutathione lyase family enzyme
VTDLDAAVEFFVALGGRLAVHHPPMASIELRGGTHLVVREADEVSGDVAGFDFMVEDLDSTHAEFVEAGLAPTTIEVSGAHRRFFVSDPSGTPIRVHSSHVVGTV